MGLFSLSPPDRPAQDLSASRTRAREEPSPEGRASSATPGTQAALEPSLEGRASSATPGTQAAPVTEYIPARMAPDMVLHTLAQEFTKFQGLKELTDNSIQSTMLRFVPEFSARICERLEGMHTLLVKAAEDAVDAPFELKPADERKAAAQLFASALMELSDEVSPSAAVAFDCAVNHEDLAELFDQGKFAPFTSIKIALLPLAPLDAFWAAARELRESLQAAAFRGELTPYVRVCVWVAERRIDVFDNGRGMERKKMSQLARVGECGVSQEASVMRFGKGLNTYGTYSRGPAGAWGTGGKGGPAALCLPHLAERVVAGQVRVAVGDRSIGANVVHRCSYTFAGALERYERGEDAFGIALDAPAPASTSLSSLEREILGKPGFGDKFTLISVEGVDDVWCSSMLKKESRLELISYLNDVYFPLLHGGLLHPLTRPLLPLLLEVVFHVPDRAEPITFKLGGCTLPPLRPLVELPPEPLPMRESKLAKVSRILEVHRANIAKAIQDKRLSDSLTQAWGKDLLMSQIISLKHPDGKSMHGLAIWIYLPLVAERETIGDMAPGLIVLHQGVSLTDQAPIRWNFMRRPDGRRLNGAFSRFKKLTDEVFARVTGFLFLPASYRINKSKTFVEKGHEDHLLEINQHQELASLSRHKSAAAAAGAGGSRSGTSSIPTLAPRRRSTFALDSRPAFTLTLETAFWTFLADMQELDEAVSLDQSDIDNATYRDTSETGISRFEMKKLKYLGKTCDVTAADGCYVLLKLDRVDVLARVCYFVISQQPELWHHSPEFFQMVVRRVYPTLDNTVEGEEEERIELSTIKLAKRLNLSDKEREDYLAPLRDALPAQLRFSQESKGGGMVALSNSSQLPERLSVEVETQGGSIFSAPFKIQVELTAINSKRGTHFQRICLDNSPTPSERWFPFNLAALPLGDYKLVASPIANSTGIQRGLPPPVSVKLKNLPGRPDHFTAILTDCWGVGMGSGKTPSVLLVALDKNKRCVDAPPVKEVDRFAITASATVGSESADLRVMHAALGRQAFSVREMGSQVSDELSKKGLVDGLMVLHVPYIRICSGLSLSGAGQRKAFANFLVEGRWTSAPDHAVRISAKLRLDLLPGPPHSIAIESQGDSPRVSYRSPLPKITLQVLDEWANPVLESEGEPITLLFEAEQGVAGFEGEIQKVVSRKTSSFAGEISTTGRFDGDFGSQATVRVSCSAGSSKLPRLTTCLTWQIEERSLTFVVDGKPTSEIELEAGGRLSGRIAVLVVSAAAGSSAFEQDKSFPPSKLELIISERSGRRSQLIALQSGRALIGEALARAPAAGEQCTLSVALLGQSAELVIKATAGRPNRWVVLLVDGGCQGAQPNPKAGVVAVAGEAFSLCLELQDSAGTCIPSADVDVDWDLWQPELSFVSLDSASADQGAARVPRLVVALSEAHDDDEEAHADAGPLSRRAFDCTSECAGLFELALSNPLPCVREDLVELEHLAPPSPLRVQVGAGQPLAIRLQHTLAAAQPLPHALGGGQPVAQVLNRTRFELRATVIDRFGNACARPPRGKDIGKYAVGSSPRIEVRLGVGKMVPDRHVLETVWPQAEVRALEAIPPGGLRELLTLEPSWSQPSSAAQLAAATLEVCVLASGQARELELEHESYEGHAGAVVHVRARVITDDGLPAPAPEPSNDVWLVSATLCQGARSGRRVVIGADPLCQEPECWRTLPLKLPGDAITGSIQVWEISCNRDKDITAKIKVSILGDARDDGGGMLASRLLEEHCSEKDRETEAEDASVQEEDQLGLEELPVVLDVEPFEPPDECEREQTMLAVAAIETNIIELDVKKSHVLQLIEEDSALQSELSSRQRKLKAELKKVTEDLHAVEKKLARNGRDDQQLAQKLAEQKASLHALEQGATAESAGAGPSSRGQLALSARASGARKRSHGQLLDGAAAAASLRSPRKRPC